MITLSSVVSLRDRATTLVHRCATVLETEPPLRDIALSLLARLVCCMGYDYAHLGFVALINDIVVRLRLEHSEYHRCVRCLVTGDPFPVYDQATVASDDTTSTSGSSTGLVTSGGDESAQAMTLSVNQETLKAAWNSVDPAAPSQDWQDWLKRLVSAPQSELFGGGAYVGGKGTSTAVRQPWGDGGWGTALRRFACIHWLAITTVWPTVPNATKAGHEEGQLWGFFY